MQANGTTQDGNLDNDNCIVDAALPAAVNFNYLKTAAIEQLKKSVGEVWSNYNDSDPGVTILDQLCYALTELGYCAQFPIADVLTQADSKIRYRDQFFEPQTILTTSPITVDDYRRLVHDRVLPVRVVYIVPEQLAQEGTADAAAPPSGSHSGRYRTYLAMLDPADSDPAAILQRVYVLLNQHRNIAEVFLPPQVLRRQVIALLGSIALQPGVDAAPILRQLREVLLNYAAPLPIRSGYQELLAQGMSADQIFDGPAMANGWICGAAALGEKRSTASVFELHRSIAAIAGVAYVETLGFSPAALTTPGDSANIAVDEDALMVLELDSTFSFSVNGVALDLAAVATNVGGSCDLEAMQSRHEATSIDANAKRSPPLPHGRYRDIEKYYSVQNTFPDQYNIGPNSLQSNAPSYQVACSRQLKGYLMPFDQLLANQFSQLARVGDLFSFHPRVAQPARRALAAATVDVRGVSHKRFSTTYFCQPLYRIPDVRPLLAGHDDFLYQFSGTGASKPVEQAAWKAYQQFPFNQYLHGMQQGLENEREANVRRDAMLNHLMARHGDDATGFDELIRFCPWLGKEIDTRIAVKSIWLQNFQELSYRRNRAFDCLSPISLPLPLAGPALVLPDAYPTRDGEPDQAEIYAQARLGRRDFAQFSAFELKAAIVLGLPKYFLGLVSRLNSLLADPSFAKWVGSPATGRQAFHLDGSDTSVLFGVNSSNEEGINEKGVRMDQLYEGRQCLLDIAWTNGMQPTLADYQAHAAQLLWLATQRRGMLLVEPVLLLPVSLQTAGAAASNYCLTAYLLLPGYVNLVQRIRALGSFAKVQQLHWPAHVRPHYQLQSFNWLKAFIPQFVAWMNSQPAPGKKNLLSAGLAKLLPLPALQG